MSQEKTYFICQQCGYQTLKWLGRCPDCGNWGTLAEEKKAERIHPVRGRPGPVQPPEPITKLKSGDEERLRSGIAEFDAVVGGGIVPGSLILIGGDPGVGKSTLLVQVSSGLAEEYGKVLYVSGEESASQIKIRADRLGIDTEALLVFPETCVEVIAEQIERLKPSAVIIDSIQTIFTSELTSAPGTVSQVRESAAKILLLGKSRNIPVFLIGHVTKDGSIAGPKTLEHMVDTVLYFEGEGGHPYRIIRTAKNRFGTSGEMGVFEMRGNGLFPVENPSSLFLSERPVGAAGSVVAACVEGSRPIMVEIQALVSRSSLAQPRRMTTGLDHSRVSLIIAVLEKKLDYFLGGYDVHINVVGGVTVSERGADLAVAAAIASGFMNKAVDPETAICGEIGLTGEVRSVDRAPLRLKELLNLGFKRFLVPKGNLAALPNQKGILFRGIASVRDAIEELIN